MSRTKTADSLRAKPQALSASTLSLCALLALAAAAPRALLSQSGSAAQLDIDATRVVSPVSPTLYGLMTEEINHSYDGGLYAEMIQNRSFHETWEGTPPWDLIRRGTAAATRSYDKTDGPSKALPYSLKLAVTSASSGNEAGLTNPGYWGYGLRPNTTYSGSLYAHADSADIGPITIRLVSNATGTTQAQAQVAIKPGPWARYEYKLTTAAIAPSIANHIEFTVSHPGTVWLQMISLMPPTFHDRPNGTRPDLMERMAAMHPKFLRLPGGNYLEGNKVEDRFDWKKTLGPLVDRPGHEGPWGYWSTDGLGLLEFLEWCEDLNVEPVLAVYAGYSLHGTHIATGKDMEPYIQDALDEVEYVTGDVSTHWGAERARDGHPAPFPLHYIEVGNEDYLDRSGSYTARYAQFAEALHARYPQYKLISTDGNSDYETKVHSDISDEHYYKSPADMMDMSQHYDKVSRTGPKIFVGEWATRSGSPTPNFGDALGDAAWMTSMERNSDLIIMASYAPLLVNVSPGGMQWPTDLIGFDAGTTYASPSYWAQSLFAAHLGDGTAASSISGANPRFFYSATVSTKEKQLHLKLVNASSVSQPISLKLAGVQSAAKATIISLHGATFEATNTINTPDAIHPVKSAAAISGGHWDHTVPPLTIEIIDVPLR
ncbi:alpha-L-arabinofuranosidase C-terminal domain-containing protein [Granulicella sibirica]|uniref:non-reducing end alpha-L-arabinofuranosidase n=1 Tax=Granulicella sibirica TaxID=2479048 RepID=A0A4Q0T4Z1_9BACT|nr:alpha-L-arabinofuranosidase C-terminal domain-containing protein [Granulicella sibirica]RXH57118.1 Alpha-N-arabinofuranosidase [Granulicella sibirica]